MNQARLGPRADWPTEEVEVQVSGGPERRVRVLRHVDPWSALKVSLAFYLCIFAVFLVVAVALWAAARQGGAIDNLENLIEDLGLYAEGSFHFKDAVILRMTAVIGPILVVLASLVTVAGVALFNLAARFLGGIEVTVLDGDDPSRRR